MKIISILLLTLFLTPVYSKENCRKVASATFYQGILKPALNEENNSMGIEVWRLMYGLSVDEYKRSRVTDERQREIAKEIIDAKLTKNTEVNAFLISDFYYAHCKVEPKQRKYEQLNDLALTDLLSCWNDPNFEKEKKRRKCFVEKMKKP